MSPILLILGSGPNIGHHVAQAFSSAGYRIVLASRKAKPEDSTVERTYIPFDASSSQSVIDLFGKVKKTLGSPPSVIVYNASADSRAKPEDPLALPLEAFISDFTINAISVFAAAQQAILGFAALPDSATKTFIFTGNCLNDMPMASLLMNGIGKSATARLIEAAATAYVKQGYKFYYADERKADGSPAYFDIDGPAAGEMYLQLAEYKEQGPWQQTYVKGAGYKKFQFA